MTENMVRTQVYLTRAVYDKLQQRAEKHGVTLALQIREALAAYIHLSTGEEAEPILAPNDPIFELIQHAGHGPEDLSENHDKYLYGDPPGEEIFKTYRPKTRPALALHEKPATYRAKPRSTNKKGRRK